MRKLHRLKVELEERIKERMKDGDYYGIEYMEKLGVMTTVKETDTENPLLILRHDGHYERYCNVKEWNVGINSGYFRPGHDIDSYSDSLIEGGMVVLPKCSLGFAGPNPAKGCN